MATINNAVMNVDGQISVQVLLILLDRSEGVELLDHLVIVCLMLWEFAIVFSEVSVPF